MANELSRALDPQEYFDFTSPLLLRAPLPQFTHAKMVISALNASLGDGSMVLPLPGREISEGGGNEYADIDELALMLANPLPAQMIQVINDFRPEAKAPGHTVRFNRPKFETTTHTAASRSQPAGTLIGTSPVAIKGEQVPLTVGRYVGPFNSTANAPGPFAIDKFDSKFSLHSLASIARSHFAFDYHMTLDTFAVALFDSAPSANVVYAGGAAADSDFSAEGSHPFDWRLMKRTATKMDTANVPRFEDGKRIMIIRPLQEEQLVTDPEYQRMASRQDSFKDMNPLFKDSYVSSVMDWHIFKSNSLSHPNNGTVDAQYAQAFGPQAVGWGLADLPAIVPNTNDNYGQTVFAVWIAFMAFGVLNDNYLYSVRSC